MKTIGWGLALALASGAASGLPIPSGSASNPLESATAQIHHGWQPAEAQVRKLAPADAVQLKKSTAGRDWRVLLVQAPVCAKPPRKLKTRAERKAQIATCRTANLECRQAKVLSTKYNAQISCSTLYAQTMVLLTTAKRPKTAPDTPQ